MNIALTGGIGCGKTSALKIFDRLGCLTSSADAINEEILNRRETVLFVKNNFGPQYLNNGKIDKQELARLIFSVPEKRKILENFLHPQIASEEKKVMEDAERQNRPCVCEIPLLFEKNLESQFDLTLCLAASEQVQIERLKNRGLQSSRARERIAAQLPVEEKMKRADIVIFNDGNLEFLEQQIKSVLPKFFEDQHN
ncbi:MAG: dephospho-CoA kinase [Opitutales bacterium]|nr:dephospho-CoA kinase [Opitutales bacterium]